MTRSEIQDWIDSQDWQTIFAIAQRDIAEAINQLDQERVVRPEWLWEPML